MTGARAASLVLLTWSLIAGAGPIGRPAAGAEPQPPDRACGRCHIDGHPPAVEIQSDPACTECHAVEELQTVGMTATRYNTAAQATETADRPITAQSMALVPGGPFWMGNNGRTFDGPGNDDETPMHEVTVGPFFIDWYETTNAMYQEFINATGHRQPKLWKDGRYPPGKANHPVVYVSWHDATEFCEWAGKRLPTETEWEKAARGTDQRIFPWGNSYDLEKANTPQHWMALHEKGDTTPVGTFEAGKSPYGLYDMAGNVYEWVQDWYLPYPGNQYPNSHYGEKNKSVRGGSWYDCLSYGCGLSAPTYNRSRFNPDIRNKGFGFRCAKSPEIHGERATTK